MIRAIAANRLKPVVDCRFPLQEIAPAMRAGMAGGCTATILAEAVRFELTEGLPPRQFSRLVP
jgi:hypothetical protein